MRAGLLWKGIGGVNKQKMLLFSKEGGGRGFRGRVEKGGGLIFFSENILNHARIRNLASCPSSLVANISMTFVCHPTQVLRANETLHLRRLLRVVEHGTTLLGDEKRRTYAITLAAANPSTGQTVRVHSQAGETAQTPPPAPSAAANSTYALPTGVSRVGGDVAGANGSGVGEDGGGTFAGDGPSDVLVPAGGEVVAIKLARVIGGAAVVPPAEGIRKPGMAEERGGGRKKQVRGGSGGGWSGSGRVMVAFLWLIMSVLALDRCCTRENDHQFLYLM